MIKIRKGFDLPLAGAPRSELRDCETTTLGLLAADIHQLNAQILVKEGDQVQRGQTLFRPKDQPLIAFTAPTAARVKTIIRGKQRRFEALILEREGASGDLDPDFVPGQDPSSYAPAEVRRILLASGLWPSFRTRPFNFLAKADAIPHAIFVNLMDSNPLAPDMGLILEGRQADLQAALLLLCTLTAGKVYVCHGPELKPSLPQHPQISAECFAGPHPAGLAGTHIHFLSPVHAQRQVWTLGAQDALAMGAYFRQGHLESTRVISFAGPMVKNPTHLRCSLGASILELSRGRLAQHEPRLISGSVYAGRSCAPPHLYLGRYHQQVVALAEEHTRAFLGWAGLGWDKFSLLPVFAGMLRRRTSYPFHTQQGGPRRAFLPVASLEQVCPLQIEALFLLRALLSEDDELAEQLGVLELDEEDVGLLSYACPSKSSYDLFLRACLQRLAEEQN